MRESEMDDGGDASVVGQVEMDCVQITSEHIRANGTVHSTPFAGIAELIDNAVDSGARNVRIENRDDPAAGKTNAARYIAVVDDGAGMDREEALKTILVGYSMKRADATTIGQFGNGLKSGSMRLGQTMLLATKKHGEFTVLMISLPYLDTVPNHKCYVPCISYTQTNNDELEPVQTQAETTKHATALALILQYSSFKTEHILINFLKTSLSQGPSGTCVVISDLKRLADASYELKMRDEDLVVESRVEGQENIRRARFSEYLQHLYIKPRVVINIQRKQVRLIDVRRSLACPRWAILEKKGMDLFAKREQERMDATIRTYEAELVELTIKHKRAHDAVMDGTIATTKQMREELRRAQLELETCENKIKEIQAQKTTRGADIRVFLGIDVEKRGEPRMVFYSNGRRICTEPLLKEKGRNSNLKQVMGVVCTIDIPSTLLPTKQNREHFEIPSEFEVVVKKIVAVAKLYFAHIDKKFKTREFWESLGYEDKHPEFPGWYPDTTKEGANKKITELMNPRRQCANCRQFRAIKWSETTADSLENPVYQCEGGCKEKTPGELAGEEIKQLKITTNPTYYADEEEPKKTVSRKQEVKKTIDRTSSVASNAHAKTALTGFSIPKINNRSSNRSVSPLVRSHGNRSTSRAASPTSTRRGRSPSHSVYHTPSPGKQRSQSPSRSSSSLARDKHGNGNKSAVLNNSVSPLPHRRNRSSSRSLSPSVPAKREKSNKFVRNAEDGLRRSDNKKRKTTLRRGRNSKTSSAEEDSDFSYSPPEKKRPKKEDGKKDSRPKRKTAKTPLTENEEEVDDMAVLTSDEERRRDMSRGPTSGEGDSEWRGVSVPRLDMAILKSEPQTDEEDDDDRGGDGAPAASAAVVAPKRRNPEEKERKQQRIVATMKRNADEVAKVKQEPDAEDLFIPPHGPSSQPGGRAAVDEEEMTALILKLQEQLKESRKRIDDQSGAIKDLCTANDEKAKEIRDLRVIIDVKSMEIKEKTEDIDAKSKIIRDVNADLHAFSMVDHTKMVEVVEKINQSDIPIDALAEEMKKIKDHGEESQSSPSANHNEVIVLDDD